ncbi:MAG: amidase [candidate division Zixibacteria bacterium]|nr:amidase [candidate division Zixibacteria bacterium]
MVEQTETLIGLQFDPKERDSMLTDLDDYLDAYKKIRSITIPNSIVPAMQFNPLPNGFTSETTYHKIAWSPAGQISGELNESKLAYLSVRDLAELIKTKRLTSVELTKVCLARLKRFDSVLHCVVTLTEDLALRQAVAADSEIAAGTYRGLLHGIPYGAKDLLSVKGYPTSWGSNIYKTQTFAHDADVIAKLNQAGAVLVAKLSLGELAWGDVWFGGTTRNPWQPDSGSSGSSAGSASAVSAGLVPFAIGSETWGSIVSPSTVCGTTGLRPTYGRVSRAGAMALSWSMDKLGPICRTVEDCAIVLDAIHGTSIGNNRRAKDPSAVDIPFNYDPSIDIKQLKIGFLKDDFNNDSSYASFNKSALKTLRDLGARLKAISLPNYPIDAMSLILTAEAASAFDDLTRSNNDTLMVRQIKNAWPNVFRGARFIPAVEYIQANRLRTMVIDSMALIMDSVDLYIAPSFEGNNLLMTNLTGHPCVVLPNGFDSTGNPVSICLIGRLYGEATLLAVAKKYQDATDFHLRHPERFSGKF